MHMYKALNSLRSVELKSKITFGTKFVVFSRTSRIVVTCVSFRGISQSRILAHRSGGSYALFFLMDLPTVCMQDLSPNIVIAQGFEACAEASVRPEPYLTKDASRV